jgi:hypothetical protein
MIICVKVRIFSRFCLLHEMLHNLGVQLLYFLSFFIRWSSIMNFNFPLMLNVGVSIIDPTRRINSTQSEPDPTQHDSKINGSGMGLIF